MTDLLDTFAASLFVFSVVINLDSRAKLFEATRRLAVATSRGLTRCAKCINARRQVTARERGELV